VAERKKIKTRRQLPTRKESQTSGWTDQSANLGAQSKMKERKGLGGWIVGCKIEEH